MKEFILVHVLSNKSASAGECMIDGEEMIIPPDAVFETIKNPTMITENIIHTSYVREVIKTFNRNPVVKNISKNFIEKEKIDEKKNDEKKEADK